MENKYQVNYSTDMNINVSSVQSIISEINKLNSLITSLYSHGDSVVLTGIGALFYYLGITNNNSLIEELEKPDNIEFLLVTSNPNTLISVPFIGDFKNTQQNLNTWAIFENFWDLHLKIKSFKLSVLSEKNEWNQVGGIKLIKLKNLENYFADKPKITHIINQIQENVYHQLPAQLSKTKKFIINYN